MTAPGIVAAVAAAVAAGLALPGVVRPAPARRPRVAGALLVGIGGLLVLRLGADRLVLAGIAAGAGGAAVALWRRRAARVAAAVVSARVLETCQLIGAELEAGRPPGEVLTWAAREWPPLSPVAEAFTLGGEVPDALRRVAGLDGAGDLRVLAAAWDVAHRSGQGLAPAVAGIVEELQAEHATRRVVASELASARATARLVATLPVFALAMGSGVGGDPWRFLAATPAGLACLAGGLALVLVGLWWIESIAAGVWEA